MMPTPTPTPTPAPVFIFGFFEIPETTANLVISGLMGAIGALFTIPVNAFIADVIKRREQELAHKYKMIEVEKELFHKHNLELRIKMKESELKEKEIRLQHLLEMEKLSTENRCEIDELKKRMARLERTIGNG